MNTPIIDTLRRAQALHEEGDLEGALSHCLDVLEQAPAHPEANLMVGVLLESAERSREALPYLRLALAHQPDNVDLRETLAGCLANLGSAAEAVTHLRQVVAAQPHNGRARFNLGRALLDCRNHAEAERVYADFVTDHPGDAEAFSHLGLARLGLRDAAGSEPCFRAAIRLNGHEPLFHVNLARALADQGRNDSAEATFAVAVKLDPGSADVRCVRAWFYLDRGALSEAEADFVTAVHLDGSSAQAAAGLAVVRTRQGAHDEAKALLAPHLQSRPVPPKVAVAYGELCRARGEGQRALVVVRHALQGSVTRLDEAALRYAEGDVLDAMGEPDAAFEAYRVANEVQALRYSPASHRALVDQLIATFDADYFAGVHRPAADTSASVVVVGMPRAGIGPVARLLQSHPAVHDAGALDDMPTMARGLARFVRGDATYPLNIGELTPDLVEGMATARMESLQRASRASVIMDRNWLNFLHLGFIATVTPGARVIHCVRDPVETCLSCYFQHFTVPRYAFSNELSGLASFYREYHRLMKHWADVLPIELLEVRYEDLVMDGPAARDRMLGFLGLRWDPECMTVYENRLAGRTPSAPPLVAPTELTERRAGRYAHRLGPLLGLVGLDDERAGRQSRG